jgi:DNA-binding transcriptional LysR family regulator
MELRDIQYFAIVAEHGHLGRAAEALGLSQPALSMSLRRLESSMHTKLVKRTPKGVELTLAGTALLSHVRRLRLSLDDVAREVADLSQGRAGHLRIGIGPAAGEQPLAAACTVFVAEAPNVTMKITVAANDLLVAALRNGELDFLVTGVSKVPYEDLVQEYLFDDEFLVFAAAAHRLAQRETLTLADIAQERWAAPAVNVPIWQMFQRTFEEHGLGPPRVVLETGSVLIRLPVIASSDMLGFTSRRIFQEAAQRFGLTELPVKGMSWTRRLGVVYRKDGYLSPAAVRLIAILKATRSGAAH